MLFDQVAKKTKEASLQISCQKLSAAQQAERIPLYSNNVKLI